MTKTERSKQGVPVYRNFDGEKFHWTGTIHKTKQAAHSAAKSYARHFGAKRRVVKLPQGWVVYARYYSI